MFIRSLFRSPEAAAALAPALPAVPPVSPERRADQYLDRLLARHGSAEAALRAMSGELFAAQDAQATAERTIAELRAKVPADGYVVLPKAEAENFAKLKALGTVDEIQTGMKERDSLKGEVGKTKAERAARDAAAAAGLDADAFVAYALRENLPVEMRDTQVTDKGKTTTKKMPFVQKPGDDKAPWVALGEYTGTLPAHDQRALKAVATAPTPTGTPYIQQAPSTAGATSNPLDAYIAQRNAPKQRPAAAAAAS